jgi:hypothetical protein
MDATMGARKSRLVGCLLGYQDPGDKEPSMPSSFRIAFVHPDSPDTRYAIDVDVGSHTRRPEQLARAIIRAYPGALHMAARDFHAAMSNGASALTDSEIRTAADALSFPGTPQRYKALVHRLDGPPGDLNVREVDAVDDVHAGFQAIWHLNMMDGADPSNLTGFLETMSDGYAVENCELLRPSQANRNSRARPVELPAPGAIAQHGGGSEPVAAVLQARSAAASSEPPRRESNAQDQRNANWRLVWDTEAVLPVGTILYKGTSESEVNPSEPSPYTWFITKKSLAEKFSTEFLATSDLYNEDQNPLVHEYVLTEEIRLPLAKSESQVDSMCRVFGIDQSYPAVTRHDAMNSGIPGWVAFGRYPEWGGDDILIGDVSQLAYQRSFDQSGADIGRLEQEVVLGM